MDVDGYIAALEDSAGRLADAADRVGLDASTPPCPGWTVRDVVGHLGGVHRWATSFVRDARTEPDPDESLATPPDDAQLLGWFREGYADLVSALRKAGDDLQCWTFLPAPTPRAFWARRQSHETAIHRVDVESSDGTSVQFDADFAVDGIDELLLGFFSRPRGRLLTEPPKSLAVEVVDATPDAAWTMTIGPQTREVTRGQAHGDCAIRGSASDLYLLLWNRRARSGLEITGDESVLDLWAEKAQVRFA